MSASKLLRKYETVVVTRTNVGAEAQRKLYEKMTELMEKAGARHIRFELWGKRRLAYPIAKAVKGIYMYHVYLADSTFVKELHRQLKLSPIVLRYLSVKLADGIDPDTYDYEKEKQFDELPADLEEPQRRPMTGWEAEFQNGNLGLDLDSDEDEEELDEEEEDEDEEEE